MSLFTLLALFACAGKDSQADDTSNDSGGGDAFPCDADYFPVDFAQRSYAYSEYEGRFEQLIGTGVRSMAFLSLYESSDTGDTGAAASGCLFSLVAPMGLGTTYNLYAADSEWVYLLGDGDRDSSGDTFYLYDPPIPVVPVSPVQGYQEIFDADYIYPGFEDPLEASLELYVAAETETVTVTAGTYDAMKLTWSWMIHDDRDVTQFNIDVTAYFDKEAGLVRQSWYDEETDTSGLIDFQGY